MCSIKYWLSAAPLGSILGVLIGMDISIFRSVLKRPGLLKSPKYVIAVVSLNILLPIAAWISLEHLGYYLKYGSLGDFMTKLQESETETRVEEEVVVSE